MQILGPSALIVKVHLYGRMEDLLLHLPRELVEAGSF